MQKKQDLLSRSSQSRLFQRDVSFSYFMETLQKVHRTQSTIKISGSYFCYLVESETRKHFQFTMVKV